MFAPRIRGALSLFSMAAIAACGGGSEPNGPIVTPSAVSIVSGNGQVGLIGTTLAVPLTVRVTSSGTAEKGVTVAFAVTSGTATVVPASAVTDSLGQAQTQVSLGSSPGNVSITATVAGTGLVATFTVTAGSTSTSIACQGATPTTPAAGGVLPGVAGTGICLGGGAAGAEYALVVFNGNPDSSNIASLSVQSHGGATAVSTANITPSLQTIPGVGGAAPRVNTLQAAFDAQLRNTARRELTPMMPAARAWMRQRGAAFNVIPSTVTNGQILTLNANGIQACTSPINVGARVVSQSNTAIVVADTSNPANGFTDADYQSFATTFDTLINPLDTQAFGQPTDIDKNGKILILFTKEVNKLTPRGSGGVIGGFFFERDLFPLTSTQTLQGCPTSNFGEMFYVLVPDPNGVFGDARQKTAVLNDAIGTLAHEYQHLINAGRRLYVNNANAFEDVWLNEGLSHIAEELLYYRVSGLAPRQNITASVLGASQTAADAFNNYQGNNFGRFEIFIGKPSQTSVYAGNDSLETRGATWNLLRYLADHRGSSDADTWSLLVNTTATGQKNLVNVFGSNYLTQIRDWATSVFADDISGNTDVRFQEPSWNMRNIFPRLLGSNNQPLGVYPLAVVPLSDVSPANLSVDAGGAAYVRFFVPANASVSIDWSTGGLPVSPLVQFTIVRSK